MSIEEYLEAQKSNLSVRQSAPAELVMQIRERTGIGVLDAKKALEQAAFSTFGARYLQAILTQLGAGSGHTLHDPIEDDPALMQVMEQADAKAEAELSHFSQTLGWCHMFWGAKKQILEEQYGVEWFSPADMNANCHFD